MGKLKYPEIKSLGIYNMKNPIKQIATFLIFIAIIFVQLIRPQSARAACTPDHIIYVASSGSGAGGCSWATAYPLLQDAIALSTSGDQIWVASGTYYPDEGATQTNNDRTSTFALKNGVALYGGFTVGNTLLSDRNSNPATNGTVLSGDLTQNDNSTVSVSEPTRADNLLSLPAMMKELLLRSLAQVEE
jgi:hypothetical protein